MRWALVAFAATLSASVALVFGPSVASGRVAAAGGNTTCPPSPVSTVNGNLTVKTGCTLDGVTVTGNVSVVGTNGNVQICGSTIIGNLTVHQNSGGPITIGDTCAGNTIGGNLEVHNNTSPVTVSSNKVGGNLNCHNDSPAVTGSPGSNTVGGKSQGECAGLGTPGTVTVVNCPASGCSASASNSDTSANVQVPGGGGAGTLTVTLTPPPEDSSCGDLPPVIGSLITIDPPGGYGQSNPIFVHIRYVQSGLSAICKSGEGFFQLSMCNPEEEVFAPCVQNLDGAAKKGSTADVEITSGDPQILGH